MAATEPPHRAQALRRLAEGLHVAEASQGFYGLEVGARMTVMELDGGLLVHSPIAMRPEQVSSLGRPRWVLAPNLLHHLHLGPWVQAGLDAWGAPGLMQKRPDIRFEGTVGESPAPFGRDVRLLALSCFPFSNEVVVLHVPSRTLVVTDLVFHFSRSAPWLTRMVMTGLRGYPGCRTTLIERLGMARARARSDLAIIASWDFDRLVMAHGEIIETGGKRALLDAFRWLTPRDLLLPG